MRMGWYNKLQQAANQARKSQYKHTKNNPQLREEEQKKG